MSWHHHSDPRNDAGPLAVNAEMIYPQSQWSSPLAAIPPPQTENPRMLDYTYDPPRPTGTRTIAHYKRIEQIGEGTYGQVYKAICIATNRLVALKKIRFSNVFSEGLPRNIIREIKILKALHHPNMVQMIEVVSSKGYEDLDEDDERKDNKRKNRDRTSDRDASSPDQADEIDFLSSSKQNAKKHRAVDARDKYKGNLFLVLEYVSHDLAGILDMGYRFSHIQCKCIFRQLLLVLDYMHENKYIHRDLKSSNILVSSNY
jgi:serine/threonine protein kinase